MYYFVNNGMPRIGQELLYHLIPIRRQRGDVWVRGMVAQITTLLGIDLAYYVATDPQQIDIKHLAATKTVINRGGDYYFMVNGNLVPFDHTKMTLSNVRN